MKMNAELLKLSLPLEEILKTPALTEEYLQGNWCDGTDTENGCNFNFLPGDTIGIVPRNTQDEVKSLISLLELSESADRQWRLSVRSDTKKKATLPAYIPPVTTVPNILETCVAIRTVPKKALLRTLAKYTKDPQEQRRLLELCSIQGSAEYTKIIVTNGVSLIDILQTFRSCKPPVERLLEHLPRLQARPYSIALSKPGRIHIAVTVVETSTGKKGLCSGWLQELTTRYLGTAPLDVQLLNLTLDNTSHVRQIPMYLRSKSDFRVPENPETSLIMIGPGTGVAPFIGFLQYRSQMKKAGESVNFGKAWLFYGCRYKDRDFIYREEMDEFLKNGILSQLSLCYSRDKSNIETYNGEQIKYVQDNIKKHKEEFVLQFMSDLNVTFLCGDAKNMAKDVHETIITCLQEIKGFTHTEAKDVLLKMQKDKRFIQDVWQ